MPFAVTVRRIVRIGVKRTEEFYGVEAAFVDVKMNVPLLKIRRAGFPDLGFGVERFDRLPRTVANAFPCA